MTDRNEWTVSDGKDMTSGRFLPGNKCAQGNATPRKTASFRAALLRCVSRTDFKAIVATLVERAKAGEPWAVKLAMQYLCGSSADVELHERLIVLERTLTEQR